MRMNISIKAPGELSCHILSTPFKTNENGFANCHRVPKSSKDSATVPLWISFSYSRARKQYPRIISVIFFFFKSLVNGSEGSFTLNIDLKQNALFYLLCFV